jgi:hypothetical protein
MVYAKQRLLSGWPSRMRVMKRLVHWKLRGQEGRSRRWREGWTGERLERQTTRALATPTRRTSAMTRGRFSFVHSSLSLFDTGYNIFDRLTVRYLEGSALPLRFRSLEAAQSYAAWLLAYEAGSATEPPASFLACYRERERRGGTTMSTAHRFPTWEAAQKWLDRHFEITEQHGMRIDLAVIHPLRACDEV